MRISVKFNVKYRGLIFLPIIIRTSVRECEKKMLRALDHAKDLTMLH